MDEVDSEKKESNIELVDISEDATQPEPTEGRTEKSVAAVRDFREEYTKIKNNERRSVATTHGNIEKVDIKKGPADEKLNVRLDLKRWDFQSLCGSEYVNDRIINEYFRLIQERNEADSSLPKVFACCSQLYTVIGWRGLEETLKMYRREDLRMKELIFFPIHNDRLFHWSLIVVETSTKVVYYFDSIPRERIYSPAPRIIKKYMEKYYENRGEKVFFKIKRREDAPCQENGYDCGVFVCQYAEKIARRSPLNFSQKDLNHPLARARDRMIQELIEGRINLEWRMEYWANEVGRKRDSGEYRKKDEKGNTLKVEKQQRRKQKIKQISAAKEEIVLERQKEKGKGKQEGEEERRKERINWPKANSPEWTRFDDDVTSLLKQIHSSHENKAETHPRIIYAVALDRFGVKEANQKPKPAGPSKRQRKCKELKDGNKKLEKAYKN